MKRFKLVVLIMIALLLSGCSNPTASIPVESKPAPDSELGLHEAYKALEERLDEMAKNTEAKRYLADFMDMAEGMWEINYADEYDGYYMKIQQLRDSDPNTYYYRSYWKDVMWYLDNSRAISPDANARRIEADLFHLSNGGVIEVNPNYSPDEYSQTEIPYTEPLQITSSASYITSSDITQEPTQYNHSEVTVTGQTFPYGNGWLLMDGKSAIQITGNIGDLFKGFYSMTGRYNADTNTLDVSSVEWGEPNYQTIQTSVEAEINLTPVSVTGLVATTPKEVSNTLASYISIPNFSENLSIYPYVVYAKEGLYLVLSDSLIQLPGEFTFFYKGKDYSFTFTSCWIAGTHVKVRLEEIDFGLNWKPDEFAGVIIADSISPFLPLAATVEQINADPDNYAFTRVSITGSYLATTATLDYSDMKVPMGQGVLIDIFTNLFNEDSTNKIEIITPGVNPWQLRECQVIGSVIYPTEEILKYLDYSSPLSKSEVVQQIKPVLLVDTIIDEEVEIADVSQLSPVSGNPSQYWGKVIQFDAYALGINYPLKTVAKTVTSRDIPLNVNLLAVGIADKPTFGSQLVIIGLNNDLVDEQGETITGKFRFKVAVTRMPEGLVSGVPFTDTAFFLLGKEELPVEIPTELHSLIVSIDPSGAGTVMLSPPDGSFLSGTLVTLTAIPAPGYTFDHWGGDTNGTSLSISIIMDTTKNVTAHFRRIL